MRAIWTGAITFGLVNVPIKLYSATEDHDVGLHQVHDADGGRIRYQRRCEVCGKVVDYEHIDKAYAEGGTTVVLTEDELKSLPEEHSKEIEVVEFVPSEQVDSIRFGRAYYLEPDKTAVKAYSLLRRTLEETDRTAIVQFSLRQKTRLAALRTQGKVLLLQTLLWDDEVREADFDSLDADVRVSAQELKMAASLVDSMANDFEPATFSDDYQEQLQTLIAAKLKQGDALDTAATFGEESEGPDRGEVVDLMEALRRSVERHRAGRSSDDSTAAKSTAGKSTAGKSTAGKSTERRRAQRRRVRPRRARPRRARPRRARRRSPPDRQVTIPPFAGPAARSRLRCTHGNRTRHRARRRGGHPALRAQRQRPLRVRRHAGDHPDRRRPAGRRPGPGHAASAGSDQARAGEPLRRPSGRLKRSTARDAGQRPNSGGRPNSIADDQVMWVRIGASTPPPARRCRPTTAPSTAAAKTSTGLPPATVARV